jgi:hypothetical protein
MTIISTTLGTQTCFGFCSEISIKSNITSGEGLFRFPNIVNTTVNTTVTVTPNYSTGVTCLSQSNYYNLTEGNKTVTTTQNFTTTVTEVAPTSSTSASFGSSKSIISVTLTGKITPADTSVSSPKSRSSSFAFVSVVRADHHSEYVYCSDSCVVCCQNVK